MKLNILLLSILLSISMSAQPLDIIKIDTSNYCDYDILSNGSNKKFLKGKKLGEFFIKQYEANYIIVDELNSMGLSCVPNQLYKLDDGTLITLDAYDIENDIGFIYVEIVNGGKKMARAIGSPYYESHKAEYIEGIRTKGGKVSDVTIIKKLPTNIKLLWADCYWFQYTERKEDDQYLINRNIAEKILRQDIRNHYNLNKKKN